MRIGWIGLGAMGAPMAANLVRAGYEVVVHNRTPDRQEPLRQMGAAVAASPAEAATGAGVVVTMVSDTPDVEQVLFGPHGAVDAMSEGSVVVDMSTIDPEATRTFASKARERGSGYVDAPVSGGTEGAEAGTLSIMCGGEEPDVAKVMPVLETLGGRITHIGASGSGQMAKAINQVIIAGTFMAVGEGIALGTAAGLDMDKVIEALSGGAAASWVLANRSRRMIAQQYPLGFKVSLHRKDLRIALAAAETAGLDLRVAKLVADTEDRLIATGLGDEDMSAVARGPQGLV